LLFAGLSLLPALMALCGKALFWPAQPLPGSLSYATPTRGLWARAGRLVTTRPVVVTLLTTIVLVPFAASAFALESSFDDLKSLPASSPSIQTFANYKTHFKDSAQVKVVINDPGHDLRQTPYADVFNRIAVSLSHIKHVTQVQSPTTSQQRGQQNLFSA